jgi:hypothetical protein
MNEPSLEEMESMRLEDLRRSLNPLRNASQKETHAKTLSLKMKKKGLSAILREALGKEEYKDLSENFRVGRK